MSVRLRSRLPSIAAALPSRVDGAVRQGAALVEAAAKQRAPDRPPIGEGLVAAIHVEQQGEASYAVIAGDSKVFWGHLVEHGTSHSAPHPFLVPALEESQAEVVALVKASLRRL